MRPIRPILESLLAQQRTLRSGFVQSCLNFPDRPALVIQQQSLTYEQLFESAACVGATLARELPAAEPPLAAVFGHRSFTAFAGVLGALLRGHGYVPLNPMFPIDRSRAMLIRAGCQALIVAPDAADKLDQLLQSVDAPLVVLMPEAEEVREVAARWPRHRFLGKDDLAQASELPVAPVDANGVAYLLFTSGSTGVPKGVMVAHRNVVAYLDAMMARYQVTKSDRFSQTFDLTFDLSVHDMFLCWGAGASLYCPTQKEKLLPGKYLKKNELSMWFAVPSTAVLMNKLRVLKPAAFPSLRYSLFCGEGLPAEIALAWKGAAPQSSVENLYGPTELTIACTLYRFEGEQSLPECELGLVPIGEPYPDMEVLIADETLAEVPPGQSGELLMTGAQLTLGYWKDPERTAAAFVRPPSRQQVFYRTGDRVRRAGPGAPLVYLGRIDNQIKVQGYRVELGEVEAVVRKAGQLDVAVAIGFPLAPTGADGIVVFVSSAGADTDAIRERAKESLPSYMHPTQVINIERYPLNANGKIDRKALLADLQAGAT